MSRFFVLLALGMSLTAASRGADVTGIWMGQVAGRNGEIQDVAFKLKSADGVITGTMFGEEYDLPIADGKISGDEVSFSVTTTNYYNMNQVKLLFRGTVKDGEIELTREREGVRAGGNQGGGQNTKQTFKLKRVI